MKLSFSMSWDKIDIFHHICCPTKSSFLLFINLYTYLHTRVGGRRLAGLKKKKNLKQNIGDIIPYFGLSVCFTQT